MYIHHIYTLTYLYTPHIHPIYTLKQPIEQPFYDLFRRGLNVSLSTDDPMLFHMSSDPLLEEYV